MGLVTITTTEREDRVLAYALEKENESRAQTGTPAITLADLIRIGFRKVYAEKEASFDLAEAESLVEAYRAADDTTQAAVRSSLKVTV